ncbi:hypothetical protein EVAR_51983_1 [Eumeta japonica]|uniref:Uncharacterized protein n=1 Tax=Eumeta variegata TaxID=151549 RepID=A0A4C1Y1R9_EUMVA|nr:hypothetical protein EVAR_51983_1 [Eumeta japonica]
MAREVFRIRGAALRHPGDRGECGKNMDVRAEVRPRPAHRGPPAERGGRGASALAASLPNFEAEPSRSDGFPCADRYGPLISDRTNYANAGGRTELVFGGRKSFHEGLASVDPGGVTEPDSSRKIVQRVLCEWGQDRVTFLKPGLEHMQIDDGLQRPSCRRSDTATTNRYKLPRRCGHSFQTEGLDLLPSASALRGSLSETTPRGRGLDGVPHTKGGAGGGAVVLRDLPVCSTVTTFEVIWCSFEIAPSRSSGGAGREEDVANFLLSNGIYAEDARGSDSYSYPWKWKLGTAEEKLKKSYADHGGGILKKSPNLSVRKRQTCMKRLMDVSEAREICKERTMWNSSLCLRFWEIGFRIGRNYGDDTRRGILQTGFPGRAAAARNQSGRINVSRIGAAHPAPASPSSHGMMPLQLFHLGSSGDLMRSGT